MRRTAITGLLLAAATGLVACGGDDEEAQAPGTTAAPSVKSEASTSPTTTSPGKSAKPRLARAKGEPRISMLASGLEVPWDIAFLPDGRAIVTERPGRVRITDRRGRVRKAPVAEVATQAEGEGGLLGAAVDPRFEKGKRFVYFYVTTAEGMQVQRWRMGGGSRLALDEVVLGGIRAGSIHDSGRLRFGPDKRLYVATGDSGEGSLAQDEGSLNGKILRLEPGEYRSSTRSPTVYSTGHRNPQGLAWPARSNQLWSAEHGPSGFDGPSGDDEVNVIRRGGNYGWPEARGENQQAFEAPAFLWSQTVAPSGISFVTLPGSAWTGDLLVATLKGTSLRRLRIKGSKVQGEQTVIDGKYGRLRAVTEAPDGSVWVTTSNRDGRGAPAGQDDRLLRVVPPAD